MMKEMVRGKILILLENNMKGSGYVIEETEKVEMYLNQEIFMMGIGWKINVRE